MSNNKSRSYICKICDKNYISRQSLWNHKNKYHNNNDNHIGSNDDDDDVHLNDDNVHLDNHNHNHLNNHNNQLPGSFVTTRFLTELKDAPDMKKKYNCKKCMKEFNNYQNRWRHEKTCNQNKSNNLVNENEILKDTLKKQNEELNQIKTLMVKQIKEQKKQELQNQEIKKTLMDLINKNCKVHPKTLQKINKQLNGDYNTVNENITNNNINNTYNIIGLGHENLMDVFSKKEKMAILKYRYCSLPHLVEYAHFNDKYLGVATRLLTLLKDAPQFKNILITNTQNTLAYKYDGKKKQFVAVNKDELLDDIVDERMCDINSFYEELENDLDEKTKDILIKVKDKIENDPAYKELKKKDIKLIIYNNRKKVSKEVIDKLEIEV